MFWLLLIIGKEGVAPRKLAPKHHLLDVAFLRYPSPRSTLDEAMDASLLLYVVDASDLSMREQLATTIEVLTEIEAHSIEHLLVLNKEDRLDEPTKLALKTEFPKGVFLSTRNPDSVNQLRDLIIKHFEKNMVEAKVMIPYEKGAAASEFHQTMRVLNETHSDEGTLMEVRGFPHELERILKHFKLEKASS